MLGSAHSIVSSGALHWAFAVLLLIPGTLPLVLVALLLVLGALPSADEALVSEATGCWGAPFLWILDGF